MKSDFEIAHEATLEPIEDIAKKVNIPVGELELYGKHIAKVPYRQIDEEKVKKSKLILMMAWGFSNEYAKEPWISSSHYQV